MFFEFIDVSATHVYHSALELSPLSSVVRKLYYHRRPTPFPRVVGATLLTDFLQDNCRQGFSVSPGTHNHTTPSLPGPSKSTGVTGHPGRSRQPSLQVPVATFYDSTPLLRPTKGEEIGFPESNGNGVGPFIVPKLGQPQYNEEERALEIQETPSDSSMVERVTSATPFGSGGTTATPVAHSSLSSVPFLLIFHVTLIIPWFFFFLNFDTPACGRLIKRAFAPEELRSLIEVVLSSGDEGDLVRRLRGDDAQTFIDVIDEVHSPSACRRKIRSIDDTPC